MSEPKELKVNQSYIGGPRIGSRRLRPFHVGFMMPPFRNKQKHHRCMTARSHRSSRSRLDENLSETSRTAQIPCIYRDSPQSRLDDIGLRRREQTHHRVLFVNSPQGESAQGFDLKALIGRHYGKRSRNCRVE